MKSSSQEWMGIKIDVRDPTRIIIISTADQVKNVLHMHWVSEEWPASIVEQRTIGVTEGNAMVSHSKEEVNTNRNVRIVGYGTQYQQDWQLSYMGG